MKGTGARCILPCVGEGTGWTGWQDDSILQSSLQMVRCFNLPRESADKNRVSSLILASLRPKNRAGVYERFILLIHHLHELRNYDGLYAVISGLREASIYRLTQTLAVVQLDSGLLAEYQELVTMMDPRGGFASYRAVVEAEIIQGRAVIPLM